MLHKKHGWIEKNMDEMFEKTQKYSWVKRTSPIIITYKVEICQRTLLIKRKTEL